MTLRQPFRQPLTLPPFTPTTWELKLPGYPVIASNWQSTAYLELLGSLPSDAEWRLVFENRTAADALALLLPWRATGGGQWPLTELPEEIAYGVDDVNFRKRLTGTSWTIAREPSSPSVTKGRFDVTIDLVHELTFVSIYGPSAPVLTISENPILLSFVGVLTIAGLPSSRVVPIIERSAGPVLAMGCPGDLSVVATVAS